MCGPLNGGENNLAGFLGGGQFGLLHNVFDVRSGTGTGFVFQTFDQLFAGFFERKIGNTGKLLLLLLKHFFGFFFLFGYDFKLGIHILFAAFVFSLLAVEGFLHFGNLLLLLLEFVFILQHLVAAAVCIFFKFSFLLDEEFLGFQHFVFAGGLCVELRFFQNVVGFAPGVVLKFTEATFKDGFRGNKTCSASCCDQNDPNENFHLFMYKKVR